MYEQKVKLSGSVITDKNTLVSASQEKIPYTLNYIQEIILNGDGILNFTENIVYSLLSNIRTVEFHKINNDNNN